MISLSKLRFKLMLQQLSNVEYFYPKESYHNILF